MNQKNNHLEHKHQHLKENLGFSNFLSRSPLTLSKSFILGSVLSVFCSSNAFLIVDSSLTSSFITLGIFCDAKIDDAKDEGCCGVDCLNIGFLFH